MINFIRICMYQKRWSLALSTYNGLSDSEKLRVPKWYYKRLSIQAKAEEIYYKKYANTDFIKDKIKKIDEHYKWISSYPTLGGYNNFSCFVHKVEKNNQEIYLFEKIYYSFKRTKDELNLYKNVESNDIILAPYFYGSVSYDKFNSLFYEYIKQNKNKKSTIVNVYSNILIALWKTFKEINISNLLYKDDFINITDLIVNIKSYSKKYCLDKQLVNNLTSTLEKNFSYYTESNNFIYNPDLEGENIRVALNGEVKIVDWDKWNIKKVGEGFDILRIKKNPSIWYINRKIKKLYKKIKFNISYKNFFYCFIIFNIKNIITYDYNPNVFLKISKLYLR